MEQKQIIHDLTLLLVNKTCTDNTPEAYIKAYNELQPKVYKAYNDSTKELRKAKVVSRSDFFDM